MNNAATTAISSNTPNGIIARDSTGNFSARVITVSLNRNATIATTVTTAGTISGNLVSDIIGPVGNTQIASGVIINTDISLTAAIQDTKFAKIITPGKVDNVATIVTSANILNGIVVRNVNGNFSAKVISASLERFLAVVKF